MLTFRKLYEEYSRELKIYPKETWFPLTTSFMEGGVQNTSSQNTISQSSCSQNTSSQYICEIFRINDGTYICYLTLEKTHPLYNKDIIQKIGKEKLKCNCELMSNNRIKISHNNVENDYSPKFDEDTDIYNSSLYVNKTLHYWKYEEVRDEAINLAKRLYV